MSMIKTWDGHLVEAPKPMTDEEKREAFNEQIGKPWIGGKPNYPDYSLLPDKDRRAYEKWAKEVRSKYRID